MSQNRSSSVMASRREPPKGLDDFPTPPPATRAFLKYVLPCVDALPAKEMSCWEPTCNRGMMAVPLAEHFNYVFASDIFDYGYGEELDFLGDFSDPAIEFDWYIFNPPFNRALDFVKRALPLAKRGVAAIQRIQWLEGGETCGRYPFFQKLPPTYSFIFAERMPMLKGRWNPKGKSATSYVWFVWLRDAPPLRLSNDPSLAWTPMTWIPPVCRAELTLQRDVERFAMKTAAPLFAQPTGAQANTTTSARAAREAGANGERGTA